MILLLSNVSLFAQYNYELKTTEDLMLQFEQSPTESQRAVVVLGDQLDIDRYQRTFDQLKTPSDDRKQIIVKELRAIAANSQAQILPRIKAITGLSTSQIETFWVLNGFELNITVEQAQADRKSVV